MSAPPRPELISKRLLVITGKGGVGKSTVAAAIAAAVAGRGLRALVAEVAGRSDVASLYGASPGEHAQEVELDAGVYHMSIEPQSALEEYLRREIPGRVPGAILSRSRAFDMLATATPGMRELLTVGKVWESAQRPRRTPGARTYDLVILDAPASGHVLGLLGAPRTFATIASVGPIARQAGKIHRLLSDPSCTSVIAVTTPEQMAVSEALGLRSALAERSGIGLAAAIVNEMLPARFTAADARVLADAGDGLPVASARWFAARALAQRAQLARLRRGLADLPLTTQPFLFSEDFSRAQVYRLAAELDRWLA